MSTKNNLTDRKTFISQYNKDWEGGKTYHLMERLTFLRPENKDMRDELMERHSKTGTQEKSKIGVEFLDENERVRSFSDFNIDNK